MNVKELILQLSAYAKRSPENGAAEVLLQSFDEQCYGVAGANDARGMEQGQHALILIPDLQNKIGVKALKMQ